MVDSQEKMLSKAMADTEEKLAKLESRLDDSAKSVEEVAKDLEGRVEAVESGTAIQKSGELGGSSGAVKKSVWSGTAFAARGNFFDSDSIINQEGR